jgi:hypothetical protein
MIASSVLTHFRSARPERLLDPGANGKKAPVPSSQRFVRKLFGADRSGSVASGDSAVLLNLREPFRVNVEPRVTIDAGAAAATVAKNADDMILRSS